MQVSAPDHSPQGPHGSQGIRRSPEASSAHIARYETNTDGIGEDVYEPQRISEARAYAQSISIPQLPISGPANQPSVRKASRPLPRPPQQHATPSSSQREVNNHEAGILQTQALRSDPASYDPISHGRTASDKFSPEIRPVNPRVGRRTVHDGRSKCTLNRILAIHRIQARILSYCSIESFLSLTGSSSHLRCLISGEVVGRWVLGQWAVRLDKDPHRSWPNLSVWEGFVEGWKHDCSSYYTYDHRWHALLNHLCLSYSLVVLFLRSLPPGSLPQPPEFEEDAKNVQSAGNLPRQSLPDPPVVSHGAAITDFSPRRMPRRERISEVVLPQPLAVTSEELPKERAISVVQLRRRSSNASFVSARSGSTRHSLDPVATSSEGGLPPVSFPAVRRYGFRKSHASHRSFSSISSDRPGSIASMSVHSQQGLSRGPPRSFQLPQGSSDSSQTDAPTPTTLPDVNRLSIEGDIGGRFAQPREADMRDGHMRHRRFANPPAIEPAFDRPAPYVPGRAPILQVFVPPDGRWPSVEATARCLRELERCGALEKMMLGDLIVNTAIPEHDASRHMLLYVPTNRYKLVPLQHTCSRNGHLPAYVDAFGLPPSYYQARLSPPYVIFVDLGPFAARAMNSLRLATDRRDIMTTSGAQMTAKRYITVAGFEIRPTDNVVTEWSGLVTLEADGTAEGREAMLARLEKPERASPWQIITEKSMRGSVWLRLIRMPANVT